MRSLMRVVLIVGIALAVAATMFARQTEAPGARSARDLAGANRIHVHSDPDRVPRALDGIEAARLAKDKGCAALF